MYGDPYELDGFQMFWNNKKERYGIRKKGNNDLLDVLGEGSFMIIWYKNGNGNYWQIIGCSDCDNIDENFKNKRNILRQNLDWDYEYDSRENYEKGKEFYRENMSYKLKDSNDLLYPNGRPIFELEVGPQS